MSEGLVRRPSTQTAALATGALAGVAAAAVSGPGATTGVEPLLAAAAVATITALAAYDAMTRRIPNRVVYPAIVAAALLCWAWPGHEAADRLAGGLIGGAVLLLIAVVSRGGLGAGDVKLAVLVGLVVGAAQLPTALVVTAVSGGCAALGALALGATRDAPLPYGPFIALGGCAVLFAAI